MGLRKRLGPLIHAGICATSTQALSTHTNEEANNQPSPHTTIKYGAKIQYAKQDSTAPINPTEKKFIQKVCGKFLFHGQAVDSTVLTSISAIALQSANPTKETLAHTIQLLDYLATQEDAVLTYNRSEMIMAVHSDARCEPKAKSRAGGHFFMTTNAEIPPQQRCHPQHSPHHQKRHDVGHGSRTSGTIYNGKRGGVYENNIGRNGTQTTATPIQTDNAMAEAVINAKITPKRSKAMDMRFHWLKDRECRHQFKFYWQPGKLNHADYWTKHHSATHHVNVRKEFLTPYIVIEMLRMKNENKNQATTPKAQTQNTETTGSSHEGVMILPVLTVSTSPYQVYGQTQVRTNRASRGDKPKLNALII